MTLLDIRHLHVEYDQQPVIDDLSLEVDAGELVAIETEVLDGATSLLKAIGGLLRGCEGEVWFRGENLLEQVTPATAAAIGFVYEERGLISLYTVFQNISLPLRFHFGGSTPEIQRQVIGACERVGLDESILTMRPHELNDVQTRLVNLARALVMQPSLLLIDELEGGMSEGVLMATMDTIRGYQEDSPVAVIMTTSSDIVIERADRVFDIEDRGLIAKVET